MTVVLVLPLRKLLEELRERARKPGVNTVLVNSFGEPWSADRFGGSFNRVRDHAQIFHVDPDTGEQKASLDARQHPWVNSLLFHESL